MDTVGEWLATLGLEQHLPAFESQAIAFDQLADLDEDDLRALGVALLGHRKRLLRAIEALRSATRSTVAGDRPAPPAVADALGPSRDGRVPMERRQLTVVFCDLVGSTELSTTLDPEDLHALVANYRTNAARIAIARGGHVAQLLGDGVLVFFGYPIANEDDAERAACAALEIAAATASMSPAQGSALQARIGIATGSVVVDGFDGTGARGSEIGAFGEAPNLAARLQSAARPGEVVVSEGTHRLLGTLFLFETLDALHLKGFSSPVAAWRLTGHASPQSRFEATRSASVSPFIGRDAELTAMQAIWAAAHDGPPSVIQVTSEPGIGKSRLCREFIERSVIPEQDCLTLQCSPQLGSSALHPWRAALRRRCAISAVDDGPTRVRKLQAWLAELGATDPDSSSARALGKLLDAADADADGAPGDAGDDGLRAIRHAIVSILPRIGGGRRVLLLAEDCHWADPETEALLRMIAASRFPSPVTVILTARPEYLSRGPMADGVHIDLPPLTIRQTRALVTSLAASRLSEPLAEIVVARSDGIPLFAEEITRSMLERLRDGQVITPADAVPLTLRDSLMSRLDRLGPAKRVAQAASVIGREFDATRLAETLEADGPTLEKELRDLVFSALVERVQGDSGHAYRFRHALIREAAYESLLRVQRVQLHARVALSLERAAAGGESVDPVALARHHEAARNRRAAIAAWKAAAGDALRLSADAQAAACYERALVLLGELDPAALEVAERIELLSGSGRALFNVLGYASEAAHERWNEAIDLAGQNLDPESLIRLIGGQSVIRFAQGKLHDQAEQLERFRDRLVDARYPAVAASWHSQFATCLLLTGRTVAAVSHNREAARLFALAPPDSMQDVGGARTDIAHYAYSARCASYAGLLHDAERHFDRCLSLARATRHGPALCWALMVDVVHHLFWERPERAQRSLDEYEPLARRLGLRIRVANAEIQRAILTILSGDVRTGTEAARAGLAGYRRSLGLFHLSEWASIVAHALIGAGAVDAAVEFVEVGEAVERDTDERFHHAELLRARAIIDRRAGRDAPARARLREAVHCASGQCMHLLALRAANELAALPDGRERERADALDMLRRCAARIDAPPSFPELRRARERIAALERVGPSR